MKFEDKKYIAELNFKSLGRGLATGALVGTGLFGGIVTGAKMAGIGRFAPQPTQQSPETPVVNQTPVIQNQITTEKPQNKPTITKPTQQVAKQAIKQETEQHQFENEHLKNLYGALVHAEHRGFVKDPYQYDPNLMIRTKSGGGKSSSYGPLQMNTSVFGFLNKKEPYVQKLMNQARNMLKSKTNHPTYGLGKQGDLSGEEHHKDYMRIGETVINGKIRETGADPNKQLSKEELNKVIKHWTVGLGSKDKPPQWYVDTVHKHYYGN